jgi:polysaccharide export outer membrane protein
MGERLAGIVTLALLGLFVAGSATSQEVGYTVKPGDMLSISVWKEEALQGEVLVTPDGAFAFPLVGQVDARGKTVTELQAIVTERLAKYISDPVVTVSVREIRGNKIYVIGQVNKAGEFIVNPRLDVMQALSMAGGRPRLPRSASSSCAAMAGSSSRCASISPPSPREGPRAKHRVAQR